MNFVDHSRIGAISSAVVATGSLIYGYQLEQSAVIGIVVYIGSLFPDLDTDSIPSRWAARLGLAFFCVMAYLNKPWPPAIAGALFFLLKADKHRGFTHKWWFPLGFIAYAIYDVNYTAWAFGVGLIVHLKVDGIKFFEVKNWK